MRPPDPGRWRDLLAYQDVWAFTLALVVMLPMLGYFRFRRFMASREGLLPIHGKFGLYGRIAATQWLLVAAMVLILHRHGLSVGDAGQRVNDPFITWMATAGVVVMVGAITALTLRRVARSKPENLEGAMGRAAIVAPDTMQEFAGFAVVSLTAGICEELLFRGWLVNLLWSGTGSVVAAVVIGAALFGAGHAYQGPRGVLRTGLVGLQLAILFVLTGSLIPGQVLHAGIDLMAGVAAVAIARRKLSAGFGQAVSL